MKEEIASIVLGEIQDLINKLEKLENQIPEHTLNKINNLIEVEILPKMQKDLKKFSQEYQYAIYKDFKSNLNEASQLIKEWDREVIDLLQLTRKNYFYLFGLAFFSGMVGASVVLCVQILFK